jgi:hypothetical protein
MDLKEIKCKGLNWIHLAQDIMGSREHVMNLWVPLKTGNALTSGVIIS